MRSLHCLSFYFQWSGQGQRILESLSHLWQQSHCWLVSVYYLSMTCTTKEIFKLTKKLKLAWFWSHFISLISGKGKIEGTVGKVIFTIVCVLSLTEIFVGQLKSELRFDCDHRSVTFDPFWDLSVPIPKVSIAASYHLK